MEIKNIKDIKNTINDLIKLRNTKYKNHVTNASNLWANWLDILSFPRDLSDESLEKIRQIFENKKPKITNDLEELFANALLSINLVSIRNTRRLDFRPSYFNDILSSDTTSL